MSHDIKNINIQFKNQIRLFVGERSKVHFDSGCKIFDVHLMENAQFDNISFQNLYTAYLTIKAKEKKEKFQIIETNGDWKILVKRFKLMPNCHGEVNSHQLFNISKDMMLGETKNITQLRFILQQPSPCWKDFSIEELKISFTNTDQTLEQQLEKFSKKSETSKRLTLDKVPPMEELANKLQNLWSLCYQAKIEAKSSEIERFDIDGVYDINSLTYN